MSHKVCNMTHCQPVSLFMGQKASLTQSKSAGANPGEAPQWVPSTTNTGDNTYVIRTHVLQRRRGRPHPGLYLPGLWVLVRRDVGDQACQYTRRDLLRARQSPRDHRTPDAVADGLHPP